MTYPSPINAIRPDIRAMAPYIPIEAPTGGINLSLGEAPSCPSNIRRAITTYRTYNRYPDPSYRRIRTKLSLYTNVPIESIVVGNGSDELIDLILRLFTQPGDQIINCPPSFGMYGPTITLNQGREIRINRTKDFSIDLSSVLRRIAQGDIKLIILCSPNNPTGTIIPTNTIIQILDTGVIVLLDEAYAEFATTSNIPLLSRYQNLIIIRTLSKSAGLAGLRIGYALMDPNIAKEIVKIKPPYNVNAAAVEAAIAVLQQPSLFRRRIARSVEERKRVEQALCQIPQLRVVPSEANCLFFLYENVSALRLFLERKSIFLRYPSLPDGSTGIRMTIGTQKENTAVISAIQQCIAIRSVDTLIFDIDGTLIDTSDSYDRAIVQTAELFLKQRYDVKKNIRKTDLARIRRIPGFNNDWDLTYALVNAYTAMQLSPIFPTRPLTVREKNTNQYREIQDIFQSLYLGKSLYTARYTTNPPIRKNVGTMERERCMVTNMTMDRLATKFRLVIASGRPRNEALISLRRFGITPSRIPENCIVAKEDVLREKPFPDPIFKAMNVANSSSALYVGDTVNDVIASSRAGIPCISVANTPGAALIVTSINELPEVLL